MRWITVFLFMMLAVTLATGPPAAGQAPPPPLTRVHAIPSAVRDQAFAVAYQDWVARGVNPCPPDQIVTWVDESYVYATAAALRCNVWLYGDAMWMQRETAKHPTNTGVAADFCSVLEHELGHTAFNPATGGYTGLVFPDNPADTAHSPDPASIMSSTAPVDSWGCRVWARDRATAARKRAGLARRQASKAAPGIRRGSHPTPRTR